MVFMYSQSEPCIDCSVHNAYVWFSCAANENHALIILCILYHISVDDKAKSLFAYTDCIPVVCSVLFCYNYYWLLICY